MIAIYVFYLVMGIVEVMSQEMTIPVGIDGKDTLTTIRFEDGAGNYDMGYNENQLTGGASFYREKGYANGTREGSYGYTTRNGLIRIVTYVADQDGYRAEVLTNEPGVGAGNPSNVTITKETEPDPEALARGPTGSVPSTQSSTVSNQAQKGSGPSSQSLQNSQSSVVYAAGSDVVRNYVAIPSYNSASGYGDLSQSSSAQVRVVSPFGQYQYVV